MKFRAYRTHIIDAIFDSLEAAFDFADRMKRGDMGVVTYSIEEFYIKDSLKYCIVRTHPIAKKSDYATCEEEIEQQSQYLQGEFSIRCEF